MRGALKKCNHTFSEHNYEDPLTGKINPVKPSYTIEECEWCGLVRLPKYVNGEFKGFTFDT
jgi:hypothetical protein